MEKKTIGSFIAVLRKSQGMTQRELAEKLCVSDKAVSRWERDETAPDLTLIPVIADIFGVTCDEILRGEKIQNAGGNINSEAAPKKSSEKQLKHLINMNLAKFKKQLWIVLGITTAGAVLCLTLYLAGYATFGLGAGIVFAIAAAVCLGVFSSGAALFSVESDELDEESVLFYKRAIYKKTFRCALVITASVFFDLGLCFTGWYANDLMLPVFAAVYFLIHLIASAVFNKSYCEKFGLSKAKSYNAALRLKTVIAAVLVAAVLGGSVALVYSLPYSCFEQPKTFDSIEDFQKFMRDYGYEDILWISEDGDDRNVPAGYSNRYYLTDDPDEFNCVREKVNGGLAYAGDTEEEFWYYENNNVQSVDSLSLMEIPIKCYTYDSGAKKDAACTTAIMIAIALFVLDVVLSFVVYFKKKAK